MVDESREWHERMRAGDPSRDPYYARPEGIGSPPSVYPERGPPTGPPEAMERAPPGRMGGESAAQAYRGPPNETPSGSFGPGWARPGGATGAGGKNIWFTVAGILGLVGFLFLVTWFIVSLRAQFGYPGSLLVVGLILLGAAALVAVLSRTQASSGSRMGHRRGGQMGRRSY